MNGVPTYRMPCRGTQEEDEAVGPDGTAAVVMRECRTLQATLLSNRSEAFLRAKPPRLAEAAESARAALQIDPGNEKAQRRLERANNSAGPGKANGTGIARSSGMMAPVGGWRKVLVQAAKKSGAQALTLFILLGMMAIMKAVFL